MSLITRCPVCGTLFKVVPDQLRISQGWVRCGQCAEIFDASADLRQSDLESFPERPVPAKPTMAEDGAAATTVAVADGEAIDVTLEQPAEQWHEKPLERAAWGARSDPAPIVEAVEAAIAAEAADGEGAVESVDDADEAVEADIPVTTAQTDPPMEMDAAEPATPEPALAAAVAEAAPAVDAAKATEEGERVEPVESLPLPLPLRPAVDAFGVSQPEPVAPAALDESLHADLSFIRPPVDEPRWRSPLRRAAWVFAGVVLLVALLLQVGLQERDRIAAAAPALSPLVQALCLPARCRVLPLREIESIVIDGSSFNSLRNDAYRLNVNLRNRADHALALPAIELSLTDIQEQPLVRRVLLPTDMAAPGSQLGARGEWSASIELALASEVGKARVVGYRLLAFYP